MKKLSKMVKLGLTLLAVGVGVIILTVIVAPFILAIILGNVPQVDDELTDVVYSLIYRVALYIANGITTLALVVSAIGLILTAIGVMQWLIARRGNKDTHAQDG